MLQAPNLTTEGYERAGDLFKSALGGIRDREIETSKLEKEQKRFDREQLLNQRADQEWNRETKLRDARKNIAAEFTANPYAAQFGGGKETTELDKQVLDYLNSGGEINEDLAKRLQARYEEALPFREDAANAVASRMIALGEDPTKAKQEADVLASGQLLSKADKQARLDAQQQMAQKYYDELAKANLEAAKMNIDIGKANLNADTDLTKLKWQAGGIGGGSTGGFGGNWGDAQETIEKMKFGDIDTYFDAKPFLNTAESMGYSPNQAVLALKQGADLGLIDKTFDIEKSKLFLQKMAPVQTGTGGTRLDLAVSGNQFMPQFAPKQIAGYDAKGFLEGSKKTLPELFKGDPTKVTEEVVVNNSVSNDYINKVKKSESNSYTDVNKSSGALGAYQFLPSTLEDLKRRTGEKFSNEEFLQNPKLQDKYFSLLTQSNAGRLEALGIKPTETNLYIAHNLGPGYVKEFQDVDTPPSKGLKKALEANRVGSKEEWLEKNSKYSDAIANLDAAYDKTGAGLIDYINYVRDFKKNSGLDRSNSQELVNQYLAFKREDAENKERSDKIQDLLNKSNDTPVARQQRIRDKYLSDPNSLTADERRWIKDSKTTPAGRQILKDLGIN